MHRAHTCYAALMSPITPIGTTTWRNTNIPFGIKDKDRLQHIYIIGKTGVGKSTLMQTMMLSDIQRGNGIAILDPHGDTATLIMKHIPPERINDVIYFNPQDKDTCIPFNPLYSTNKDEHHLITSNLIATFKHIWGESWGPRLEYILLQSILTLLAGGNHTLLDIQPLLVNPLFRESILATIENKQLLSFWLYEYDKYSPQLRAEAIAPILNKVGVFSSNAILKSITGNPTRTIPFDTIMNNKKLLICNLSKGIIGEDVAAILGSMLLSSIHLAAMKRAALPQEHRTPFYCYIDEMHSFISDAFIPVLSESRKYGLSLCVAHQYLAQLPDAISSAVFGNVGTIISFRVGAADAAYLAEEFYPVCTQDDFINLPPYHIYLRLLIDGLASKPFSAVTRALQQPSSM